MRFFKRFFGSREGGDSDHSVSHDNGSDYRVQIPDRSNMRLENLSICHAAGFMPSRSLPSDMDRQVRPALDIARRLNAIKALIMWLMVPEEAVSDGRILEFIDRNSLAAFMTEEEKLILNLSRDDEQGRNAIGWKFENAWPLAWYFGYRMPDIGGSMMSGEQMQEILTSHSCPLDSMVEDWVKTRKTIHEMDLIKTEDLFYCIHNAVRSAQLGGETVPAGFDPVGNGGVIHERRHELTWMLSSNIKWEDTDLST